MLYGKYPATNGMDAGLYLPSGYGIDSGIGISYYSGKSVISSGLLSVLANHNC